jgi:hypothetical protein
MEIYNKYPKGSEWRKWDLHIHAPSSALNNQFDGQTEEEKWEKYFEKLSSLKDIAVLGITDYFSIEGYKKVIGEKNKGNLANVDLILPNVEMRIIPVTKTDTPINLHIIFSPEIVDELDTYFFSELEYEYQNVKYKCTRDGITKLGKAYKNDNQLDDNTAYIVGIEQFKTDIKDINNIFQKHSIIRNNSVVLVSNSNNDGNSGIQHSSLTSTRENIYRFADFIFSGNPNDREYFLGKRSDNEIEIIRKYGRLKPCVHGSDAHCLEKICKPDLDRYTWIKADPTFNGLKQLIYEPETRVRIQSQKPENKTSYLVIDKVRFIDNTGQKSFSNEWIELNENMNVIIGGKSSGKSLLSYFIAKTIDPNQIKELTNKKELKDYSFGSVAEGFDFEVLWKDGVKNALSQKEEDKARQVTYIPQLYINKLAEEKNAESLDKLILEILLQNDDFSTFYKQTINTIEEKKKNIGISVNELFNQLNILKNQQEEFRKLGDKGAIINEIELTNKKIKELIDKSNLTDDENKAYKELDSLKIKNTAEITRLKEITTQLIVLKEFINSSADTITKSIQSKSDEIKILLGEETEDYKIIKDITSKFCLAMNEQVANFVSENFAILNKYEEEINKLENENTFLVEKMKPFVEKLKDREQITELEKHLKEQNNIVNSIQEKELLIKSLEDRIKTIINQALENYECIYENYISLKTELGKENYKNITNDIQLTVDLKFDCDEFSAEFMDMFNKTKSFKYVCEYIDESTKQFKFREDYFIDDIKHLLDNIIDEKSTALELKANKDRKTAVHKLFEDYFKLKYCLYKDGDPIYNMSPGKQGLVLLQLFLHLSNAKHPIIIDQPEDNLDNRTISSELVRFIRNKKIERQIVLVTHNANIAVLGDAEEIIVANQAGQQIDRDNLAYKFEYVTGALEHSFENPANNGILYKKGIKEHTCEILEGGKDAFKIREDRYGIS